MADSDFADYVEARYQGEVFGEAVFALMAEARADGDEQRKLRALERLERETKERLLPAVRAAGRSVEPDAERLEQARAVGSGMGQSPWREMLEAMVPTLERAVAEFRAAESLAPPGAEALLRQVTAHEQALLDFARAELQGGGAAVGSLSSVEALFVD